MPPRLRSLAAACAVAGVLWSAAAAAQPFVYVANLGDDTVAVIDAATLGAVAVLPVGDDPDGIAVSPDGRRVYVSGFLSDTVGIIDAETNLLLATLAVGAGPVGLAATPDGERVYVTQRGADSVAAIGVASGTVEAVIPVGRGPNAIAITPDGRTAFVTNSFAPRAGEVSVLDLASDTVRRSIAVARKPSRVAITPDGRTAYVTNFRSWTSTAIDVATETVRTTFRAGYKSSAVAVNPNGVWAYIADRSRGGALLVIDVAADQVTRALPLGGEPTGIGLLRTGGTAYVSDFDGVVHVVDLGEEQEVAGVGTGNRPFAVAANCVGAGCDEAPYTPKPTRTATATPTATPTPTTTLTATATASATTTRTLPSDQRPVDFTLTFDPVDGYGYTIMDLVLDPGGQAVHGIRQLIQLPDGIEVKNTDRLDCLIESAPDATRADFSVVVPEQCGFACRALSVAIDFSEPIETPTVVHSCVLYVDPFLPQGTTRLRQLDHTALDADGGALPSRGRDGILVVAPPASPSPGLTPRPTRTPTPAPPPEVFIGGDPVAVRAGARATVSIRLASGAHRVSGAQNDLEFAPGIAVAARAGGRPDCAVNPAIDKTATSFAFQPPGCTPGDGCTGVRALVLSFEDNAPIADGVVLYTCALTVAASVAPGVYALPITLQGASTPEGLPLPTGASPLRVTVEGALLARRALAAGADGALCAGDADCPAGACVLTQGVCDGGDDDGLLCDCPGGACRAGASGCAGAADGVCQGGGSDGACCDRGFVCRGDGACRASHRLCAGGPAKGSPCLGDGHCLGSACLASARRCAGGALDGVACIDPSDCPAAACVDPNAPPPTALATATPRPVVLRTSNSDGCAVTPARDPCGWWLAPALLWLIRRRRGG